MLRRDTPLPSLLLCCDDERDYAARHLRRAA